MNQSDLDNRFTYHAPTADQPALYEAVRAVAKEAAEFYNDHCPEGREKSLAITHLEEAVFWANAAIARTARTSE
jgi:hypothetical protein